MQIDPSGSFKIFEFGDDGFSEQSDQDAERADDGVSANDHGDSNAVKIITLNVGGRKYRTTLMTLTTCNSKLKKWFSGNKVVLPQMKDGSYFIDTDPTIFYYILQYLRNKTVVFDDFNAVEMRQLLFVASQFHIDSLTNAIRRQLQTPSNLNWMDQSDHAMREIPGSNIVFLLAKNSYWEFNDVFELPEGLIWATMPQFAIEYESSRGSIAAESDGEGVFPLEVDDPPTSSNRRLFFVFKDTPSTQAYIPARKNLISAATHKVWKAFDETDEYNERQGINPRYFQTSDSGIR